MKHPKLHGLDFGSIKRDLIWAARSIVRGKLYSILNILGLSLGLASSFLIILFILAELGYDKCHKSSDSIFRLSYHFPEEGETNLTPFIGFDDIKRLVPGINQSCLMGPINSIVHFENTSFEAKGKGVEGEIFDMFTIPLLSGNYGGFYDNANSIIITNSLKIKLFGAQAAVGNFVSLNIQDSLASFLVTGVMENLPTKSSIQADFFIQNRHLDYVQKFILAEHYILIPKGQTDVVKTRINRILTKFEDEFSRKVEVVPQPLREIHFKSAHITNNRSPSGDLDKIFIVGCIGLLILISSIINYISLASSRTMEKSRDIAIYKTFGAMRQDVISIIMTESVLLSFISFPVAIVFSHLFLRYAKLLLRNDLSIDYTTNWPYILIMLVVIILVGFTSGFYTAFVSSKIPPIDGLINRKRSANRNLFLKGLLILQIGVFTSLIMFSLVINRQLSYSMNYEMGFNNDNIVNVNMHKGISYDQYLVFSDAVASIPGVLGCVYGSDLPQSGATYGVVTHFTSKEEAIPVEYLYAGPNYMEMCDFGLVSGRFFEKNRNEDGNVIVNETALHSLGINDPIGERIENDIIIGVVKDFVLHSLHSEIPSVIISHNDSSRISNLLISLESSDIKTLNERISSTWNELFPEAPYELTTFSDTFGELYENEIKLNKTISLFTILAVLISCLGLFGLTHFTTRRRTMEIGIRKVNGAKTKDIISLVYLQSLGPYLISILCCIPLTYFLSNKWLANFAYSSTVDPGDIVLSVLASLIVFSLPIVFLSYKASTENPVNSLKHD
jgi:putative ABC transport system permease protein